MLTVLSSFARLRLDAARRFVLDAPPDAECVIVAASRSAADDFARDLARQRGATFGMHRFSLTQLAARLAAPLLAASRLAPTTPLGMQAVAARSLFEARRSEALSYFEPVADSPGFSRALAHTLEEMSLAMVPAGALQRVDSGGRDLGALLERFDEQFQVASAADRSRFLAAATRAVLEGPGVHAARRLLLLDVPISNAAEDRLVGALIRSSLVAFATSPRGDERSRRALASWGDIEDLDAHLTSGTAGPVRPLERVPQHLFSAAPPPTGDPLDEVELFSAPGEGRECVEIARRVLREARRGVPFDRMAVALRAPQQYSSLLEHALERAGIPAYFERGTRRPHPAGRAFLALLRCAADNLSTRRFAEYLSLGQVPDAPNAPGDAFPASSDEVFGASGQRAADAGSGQAAGTEDDDRDVPVSQAVRSPWKWEQLLAESRVIATVERWDRRLAGLASECELQIRELQRTEPDSGRIDQLTRKIADIQQLAAFALPIIRMLGDWPARATWGEWLERFVTLASQALRRPDRVLRVLADLAPMGTIGPIGIDEAAVVLADRLRSIEAEPPARRYGRLLVTTPAQLRGRSFEVVFVPSLAERMFPQRPREDPLLLDESRVALDTPVPLVTQAERAELEKLQLRLAIGAAESRLYVSFPTVEVGDGRPRVPSLYALEVWRAMTGRVPGADELQRVAANRSQATLAWPAPLDGEEAIDSLEHDLSTLRALAAEPEQRVRGHAQYMLQLNDCLQRSVRERYMRGRPSWSHWDGIATATDRLKPVLAAYRLGERAYSVSALQKYSTCPYQFFLSAIWRMRPAEDLEPLYRMDPLTRGSLFHAVQTDFFRRLRAINALPVARADLDRALTLLDEALAHVAAVERERLSPAIDRVWKDEIAAMRRDLRLWVDETAGRGEWTPKWFEWSFGLRDAGRDEASRPEPVLIDGRFKLHGSIDLVEEHTNGQLRITDHKTGKYRGKERMVVDGGAALQPVLYAMALEAATGRTVSGGRLYYATTDGGYREVEIPLTPQARRLGVEVLEIIDRAVETGFLAPVPREKACAWCDFRIVCGPTSEERVGTFKSREPLADLDDLRRKP
ncbi:MAG TPA: PD-(D/E)XK nuclease family protein [Vicinamibacterales bacterium]|nr:PD-(D/E)XK nuclease family protein [Vicinamibacterales bacterium]